MHQVQRMCEEEKTLEPFRAQASTATGLVLGSPSLDQAYHAVAAELLHCAKKLDETLSDLTGEYILLMHSSELGLKAYLAKNGFGQNALYGHNLVDLLSKAKQHGLTLKYTNADQTITWLNEWHNDRAKIRYDFSSTRVLPMCRQLFPLIEEIIWASSDVSRP